MSRRPRTPGDVVREYLIPDMAGVLRALQEELAAPLGWVEDDPQRRPGRPLGRTHSRVAIVKAFRELKQNLGRKPTQRELGANLKPEIGETTVRDNLKAYGLPWPIE